MSILPYSFAIFLNFFFIDHIIEIIKRLYYIDSAYISKYENLVKMAYLSLSKILDKNFFLLQELVA